MRKRTRRRHFDLDANPVRIALIGRQPVPAHELRDVSILDLWSLARLSQGAGGAAELATLTRMVKVAERLALMGHGPELLALVPGALGELAAIAKLPPGGPRPTVDLLTQLQALHEEQVTDAPRVDYEAAIYQVNASR